MSLGTLRIRLPDGTRREFPVDEPSLMAGRAPDSQLVIEHASVARRHARLTVEAGRLFVEDLGSAAGTFVGTQRLAVNIPTLVAPGQALRLGDVEISFAPSGASGPARTFAEPAAVEPSPTTLPAGKAGAADSTVKATLTGPQQPVAPGSLTTATLTLENRGSAVDEFVIRVSGVPNDWVHLARERVALLPGGQEQVVITFQPPRRAEAVATDHNFTLSVISREHHTGVNVPGTLKVLPYQGFVMNLQPVRSRRDFQLLAQNQGNAPVTYQLSGQDDAQALVYRFDTPVVNLQPGETATVPLQVTLSAQPRIGTRETRAFTVVAQPAESAGTGEVRTAGQLLIRPPIPIWLVPLVILLSLCLLISAAYAYVTWCDTLGPELPFCPAGARPQINLLSATPAIVDPGDTVVITWDVSNAETVEMVSPMLSNLGPSGYLTFNLIQNTTFTLRATNFAGTIEQSVTVQVRGAAPAVQLFTADPGVVTAGQAGRVRLSWAVLGVDTVSIEGVPGQTFPATGSVEVDAPTADTTYTLVAINDAATVRESVTVVISAADCAIANLPGAETVSLRQGPAPAFPASVALANGTRVAPFGRNSAGDWIRVRAVGREGWVPANFIGCTNVPDFNIYPTAGAAELPTLAPTPTYTPVPASGVNQPAQ